MELLADNETLECPQDWTFENMELYGSMKFWIGITICILGFTGIILNIGYSCLLMDPTEFCPFFTTSCLLMDPKTSCLLMEPSPLETSCFLMDPKKIMSHYFPPPKTSFDGPKTSCLLMDLWWFFGSIKRHEVFGSTERHECRITGSSATILQYSMNFPKGHKDPSRSLFAQPIMY